MRYSAALAALAMASLASAQNATTVVVGLAPGGAGPALAFDPPTVKAANGTTITFEFRGAPGNHTVTQSTFANPCAQLAGGFDSGYIQIPAGTTEGFPTWNLTITDDSKPIWYYCAQTNPTPHCIGGMVGGINTPETGNTYDNFLAAAKAIPVASFSGSATAPALTGPGASATAAPGPFSGSITGFAIPTAAGGASGSGSASGGASGTGSGSGAPAPSTTGNNNGAMSAAANGVAVLLSMVAGAALL